MPCRRSRAVGYSEATTYTYDVVSTLQDPCHRHHRRRRQRKERPRREPPVWREGLRLSLGWLKPPVPRSSDPTVEPALLLEYGVVTSPSPGPGGGGGSPHRVSGERELSGRPPRRSGSNWPLQICYRNTRSPVHLFFIFCGHENPFLYLSALRAPERPTHGEVVPSLLAPHLTTDSPTLCGLPDSNPELQNYSLTRMQ